MRIGVVVPVYNRRGLVRECLESIAAQTRAPERVVIVDDASTDGTSDGIEEWIGHSAGTIDWNLRRSTTNGGPSRARNVAMAELDDCDTIAFLDSELAPALTPVGFTLGNIKTLWEIAKLYRLHFYRFLFEQNAPFTHAVSHDSGHKKTHPLQKQ